MHSSPQGDGNKITCLENFRVKNQLMAWMPRHKHSMGNKEWTPGKEAMTESGKSAFERWEMYVPVLSRLCPIPEPRYFHVQDKSREDLKWFCILPLGTRRFQILAKLGRVSLGREPKLRGKPGSQTAWLPFNLGEGLGWAGAVEWRILGHTQAGASPRGHAEKLCPAFDYWCSPEGELLRHQDFTIGNSRHLDLSLPLFSTASWKSQEGSHPCNLECTSSPLPSSPFPFLQRHPASRPQETLLLYLACSLCWWAGGLGHHGFFSEVPVLPRWLRGSQGHGREWAGTLQILGPLKGIC